MSDIMTGITAASREQSVGNGSVNVAIAQVEQATKRNAALMEGDASGADSMQK